MLDLGSGQLDVLKWVARGVCEECTVGVRGGVEKRGWSPGMRQWLAGGVDGGRSASKGLGACSGISILQADHATRHFMEDSHHWSSLWL